MHPTAPSRRRPPSGRHALAWAAAACLAAGAAPALAATFTWNGGGTTNNWSNGNNWGGTDIVNNSTLRFAGTQRLNAVNNLPDATMPFVTTLWVDGLSFMAGAGAFNLSGNRILSMGNITNLSSQQQTLSLPVSATVNNQTWDGGSAGMRFTGEMTMATINLTVRNNVAITNAERPFIIGDGGNATMSLQSGSSLSFASASNLTLGSLPGNTGTLNVSGDTTTVTLVDRLSVGYGRSGLLDLSSGVGVLNLSTGAEFSSASARIGDHDSPTNIGGSGTVNLGSGARWYNTNLISVGRGSTATLSASDGARVETGSMRIADNSTRPSTVNLSNGRLSVTTALTVAHNGSGTLTANTGSLITSESADIGFGETGKASTGTASLNSGSSWINQARMTVGQGGTGTLNINAGSTVDTNELFVGAQFFGTGRGSGTVNVTGSGALLNAAVSLRLGSESSALNIRSGGLVQSGNGSLGRDAGDRTSRVRIESGGAWEIVPTAPGQGLIAANSDIVITTGGRLSSPLVLLDGNAAGDSSLLLENNTTLMRTQTLTVGDGGTASLTLRDRARLQGNLAAPGVLRVARGAGSNGSVTVSGMSVVEMFDSVRIGDSGAGTLSILGASQVASNTATIASFGGVSSVKVDGGSLFIQTGTLTVGSSAGQGSLVLSAGGVASSGRLVVGAAGKVTLAGGRLDYASSSNDTLASGGVFEWQSGSVNVRGSTDLVRNDAFLRGALVGSMLSLSPGRTLQVRDTFDIGDRQVVLNGGVLQAHTLKLGGGLVLTGTGEALVLGPAAVRNLQGQGTVASAIGGGGAGADRSRIVAEGGTLTLGLTSSPSGFSFSGLAEARANSQLLLLSAGQAQLSHRVMLHDGARLSTLNGALLTPTGTLEALSGAAAEVMGRFTNQGSVDGGTGSLTFLNDVDGSGGFSGNVIFRAGHSVGVGALKQSFGGGDAHYASTAELTLDLLGLEAGTGYDQLTDIDQLSFEGRLNLVFGDGFAPADGSVFQLFGFQGFSGSLDAEDIEVTGFDRARLDFSRLSQDGSLHVLSAVPEPGTWAMWSAGLLALLMHSRRRGLVRARLAGTH